MTALVLLSMSAMAHAQEMSVVHRNPTREVATPEPAPDRLVEIGGGFRYGASTTTALMAVALDAYVPRYFFGARADAASYINIFGHGYRETFGRISVGVARQLPIPSTKLSLSLFAGPTFGSMTLDWRAGWSCDNRCSPEPRHNPALGTYLVYGGQAAASLSIHLGGFFIGIAGSASIMRVANTAHLTGFYGSRLGFSM